LGKGNTFLKLASLTLKMYFCVLKVKMIVIKKTAADNDMAAISFNY